MSGPESRQPQDDDLDALFSQQSPVLTAYRQQSTKVTPPALDALILAAASNAPARPAAPVRPAAPQAQGRWHRRYSRWSRPLAAAASVVLVSSVLFKMGMSPDQLAPGTAEVARVASQSAAVSNPAASESAKVDAITAVPPQTSSAADAMADAAPPAPPAELAQAPESANPVVAPVAETAALGASQDLPALAADAPAPSPVARNELRSDAFDAESVAPDDTDSAKNLADAPAPAAKKESDAAPALVAAASPAPVELPLSRASRAPSPVMPMKAAPMTAPTSMASSAFMVYVKTKVETLRCRDNCATEAAPLLRVVATPDLIATGDQSVLVRYRVLTESGDSTVKDFSCSGTFDGAQWQLSPCDVPRYWVVNAPVPALGE